ncbi:MAG: DUF3991 domain-containing protein [Phycisphaerales bacterium]|nr:DUF3991 domain-containing protein [Phycisphaerales bacterium]
MPSRTDELEHFRTAIDLRVVAADLGYTVNRKRSSRGSTCMDHPNGDRVLVALGDNGHFVYCSVRDPGDTGSVIDFWQRRRSGRLGEVRKALRAFADSASVGEPATSMVPASSALPPLVPVERDILNVQARYETFGPLPFPHDFLCEDRGLPAELLALSVFANRLRVDGRGNAIFPHYGPEGLCGWEARGPGFTSFARGGRKGLWCSAPAEGDDRLVIAESGIDALSYAAVRGAACARFVSFAGGLNPGQPELLVRAIDRMPAESRIIAAVDNDDAGDRFVDQLAELVDGLDRDDLAFLEDRPGERTCDWNDALRSGSGSPQLHRGGRPEPA